MISIIDHPYVTAYLAQFDALARTLPPERRATLRKEIASHLRDLVSVGTADIDASLALEEFGGVAEIVDQESLIVEMGKEQRPRRKLTRKTAAILVFVIALSAAAAVATPGLVSSRPPSSPASAPASVVNSHPDGASRVTRGTAYAEYRYAITTLKKPLPRGAHYPIGVPKSLDEGKHDGGVLEAGGGTMTADFTWLCAWEVEYLSARKAKNADRQVTAERMIRWWPTSPSLKSEMDVESIAGWTRNVIDPMSFNDPSGVQGDVSSTCATASIYDVFP